MVIGIIVLEADSDNGGYGILPTFAAGYYNGDKYTLVSMYFFVFSVFAEGLIFAYLLD